MLTLSLHLADFRCGGPLPEHGPRPKYESESLALEERLWTHCTASATRASCPARPAWSASPAPVAFKSNSPTKRHCLRFL